MQTLVSFHYLACKYVYIMCLQLHHRCLASTVKLFATYSNCESERIQQSFVWES